jgi:hypothetical protein
MASTPDGRRLTEAHRLAQARIGASAATDLLAAFDALDPEDLDGTTPRWLRVARQIVAGRHQQSAALAVRYYVAFRQLEAGRAALFMPELATLQVAAVDTSLTVTGPVAIKQAMTRGEQLDQAVDVARAVQAREGIRHTLAGGRDTITRATASDPVAVGWARATSGNACHFCQILASRGPVYSEDTVDFEAHGGCSCSAEPAFSRDTPWPPGSQEFRDLWDGDAASLARSEGISQSVAFRRLVEGRT